MPQIYTRLVEIGRVCYVARGLDEGKLCTIVEIIDGNRALVDGPETDLKRQVRNFKDLELTKLVVPIRHGARTRTVRKEWIKSKTSDAWKKSEWAKKLRDRHLRANLSDFDRFKLMKAKQARNRIVRVEMAKLKKAAKKK